MVPYPLIPFISCKLGNGLPRSKQPSAAVGVQLRAADQAAEGIVLEAVARKLARRIAVAQARKRTLGVVSIGNVTTAIIRLPDQSVKPVIGIADGIAVGVGRGFQVAAARGVVTCAGQSASGKNPAYTSRSSQGFPELSRSNSAENCSSVTTPCSIRSEYSSIYGQCSSI